MTMNMVSKFGLVTIIILVVTVICLITVIFANSFNHDLPSSIVSNALQTLNSNESNECQLLMNGNVTKSLMLTDTDKLHTIHLLGPSLCQARILVVGGGGNNYYGGGGSGQVLYHTIQMKPGSVIVAKVGELEEPSIVTMPVTNSPTVITYTAEAGQRGGQTLSGNYAQEGRTHSGGNGYSGGGGGFYRRERVSNATRRTDNNDDDEDDFEDAECVSRRDDSLRNGNGVIEGRDGGSDGGNGEGDEAGAGSGQDVSTFTFNTWVLTPGDAGQGYNSQSGTTYFYTRYYGGGGGGVLVDGEGPGTDYREAKGYGGGRGAKGSGAGGAGVILIEVDTI